MTDEEQRAAAYRYAVNTLELVTEEEIRAHLGIEYGGEIDVQNTRYYVQTAKITIPPPEDAGD